MKMRINCKECGEAWEVYPRGDWTDDVNRECPSCGCSIDRQTWENQIKPAFGAFMDMNREIIKDSTGYGTTLFTVSFMAY